MGSLGDKFKKLAGDQTRQLLQNFQNAQSSKTRNGYSYGKLNEDGTATLADGTTVQVEVKGRPGQYAPVFNLGNGQGLVDQPEAKFFNVDSNIKTPWIIVAGNREPTIYTGEFLFPTGYIPTSFYICNLITEERYNIPLSLIPSIDGPHYEGDSYRPSYCTVYDFSLDMRHIVICSVSDLLREINGEVSPVINYAIVKNWSIVSDQFSYEEVIYGTFSGFFNSIKEPTTSYLSDTLPYQGEDVANIRVVLKDASYIPILTSDTKGNPALSFWISGAASLVEFGYCWSDWVGGPPSIEVRKFGRKTGVSQTCSIHHSVNGQEYVEAINSYEPTGSDFSLVTSTIVVFRLTTTGFILMTYSWQSALMTHYSQDALAYNGSFIDSTGYLCHIVGVPDYSLQAPITITMTDLGSLESLLPNPLETSTTIPILNYGVYKDGSLIDTVDPNRVSNVSSVEYYLFGGVLGQLVTTTPESSIPVVSYGNYILLNTSNGYLRYQDIENSLNLISPTMEVIYQYDRYSLLSSLIDTLVPLSPISRNYPYREYGTTEYNVDFVNNGMIGSISNYFPQVRVEEGFVRFGPSRPSGQAVPGKVALASYCKERNTFNLIEIRRDDSGVYKAVKTIDLVPYILPSTEGYLYDRMYAGYSYAIGYR